MEKSKRLIDDWEDNLSFDSIQPGYYLPLCLLGGCGIGEVYLAEDYRLTQVLTIKFLSIGPESCSDASSVEEAICYFRRDMKAISFLDHPNTSPLLYFDEKQLEQTRIVYIIMPYCAGGSLAGLLQCAAVSSHLRKLLILSHRQQRRCNMLTRRVLYTKMSSRPISCSAVDQVVGIRTCLIYGRPILPMLKSEQSEPPTMEGDAGHRPNWRLNTGAGNWSPQAVSSLFCNSSSC